MAHQHDHHHHDDGHGHDHSHIPAVTGDNERRILISFFVILAFMVVETVGGVLSGSLALLADAGHMLTDAAALGLAYTAFRLGRRAADSRRSFGYARFEVIAGLINALTLFGIVGFILYEAVGRFREPQPVLAGSMLAVAVIGLMVNLFVLWFLTRGDTGHVNVRGAVLHVMGDLLGSIGAIVAALVIRFTGWVPVDPLLSVLVSLLILRSAWSLLKNTLHILLEGAPDGAVAERITAYLKANIDGIADVGHVHVWQITSGRVLATLKVRPAPDADLVALTAGVEQALRSEFAIEHPTVGIDWTGTERCSLDRPAVPAGHIGEDH